jgi:hypothetical protein
VARIRSIKPELRTDLTVASWPIPARYAWILLWGYLDDAGRGRDDLRLLIADLFPLDRDVTEKRLDGWLRMMTQSTAHGEAALCRYEVGGARYLHAVKWRRHQRINRPTASRIPPCPIHEPLTESLSEDLVSDSPPDQGSKGSGSKGSGQTDVARIQKRLQCDESWARRVAMTVLSKAPTTVANPTGYVLTAIDADEARFRPTPQPPRFAFCRHGVPVGACDQCPREASR